MRNTICTEEKGDVPLVEPKFLGLAPYAALIAALTVLAACATAPSELGVDPQDAAVAAETPPDLQAVADGMAGQVGTPAGDGLTLDGARAEGNQLVLDLRHDQDFAFFSSPERDKLNFEFDRTFPTQMCASPVTRRFIEEEGGIRVNVFSADGQSLTSRTITECS